MNKKILVVVDMQNDFITGPLGTPEAVSIVDKIVEKIRAWEEWDRIYITHDTHYGDYLKTQEGRNLPVEHCIYNTEGWWLNNKIRHALVGCETKRKQVFWIPLQKETFGAFNLPKIIGEDFDGYSSVELEVTLVGVCTDICVISNALLLKAHYPGMNIVVDASCCAGSNRLRHQEALDVMRSCQIKIINDHGLNVVLW